MKVFVTGADGFIGSHRRSLVRSGHNVRALVQYNSFNSMGWLEKFGPGNESQIEVVAGDVRDRSQMSICVQGCERGVPFGGADRHTLFLCGSPILCRHKHHGNLNILEAVRSNNNTRMITLRQVEVYGSAQFVPITEDHPLQGAEPILS